MQKQIRSQQEDKEGLRREGKSSGYWLIDIFKNAAAEPKSKKNAVVINLTSYKNC